MLEEEFVERIYCGLDGKCGVGGCGLVKRKGGGVTFVVGFFN